MWSIGAFSKICSVTIKALHHYDKIGLVKPAYIDEENGYRYYDTEQLSRMLLILRLKRYQCPLVEIKALLDARDWAEAYELLENRQKELNLQLQEQQIALLELGQHLESLERTKNLMMYQNDYTITLVERDPLSILSNRHIMGVNEFGNYFGELFEKLSAGGFTPIGPVMSIYHDEEFNPDRSDIELAIPIAESDKATRLLNGGIFAMTTHTGAYSSLADAYGAIANWIEENGYRYIDSPFDIYTKSHRDGLPIESWETEIYFPIEKK